MRADEAAERERVEHGFGTAREDGVGKAELDRAEGLPHGLRARCARGGRGQVGALGTVADGDVAGCDVADHLGDEQRGNAVRALLEQDFRLLDEGLHAADARAHIDAEALGGDVGAGFQPALLHRLGGSRLGEQAEAVIAPGLLDGDAPGRGVEVPHDAGHADRKAALCQFGALTDSAAARLEGGPESCGIVADRRNDAGAGDDDSSLFHYLYIKRRMLPLGVLENGSKRSSKSLTAE